MHMMLTENEAARLRFEELQSQAEEADLSEVEATNCIYVAGVDKHNRPVVNHTNPTFYPEIPWTLMFENVNFVKKLVP